VLIGGLLTSTLLTLVFVPAMFTIFDDAQRLVLRLFRRGKRPPREATPPPPAPSEPLEPTPVGGGNGARRREAPVGRSR